MAGKPEIKEQLAQLEAMRSILGEELYQQARARLEGELAALKGQGGKPESASSPRQVSDLETVLQSRQVNIHTDAHGNVIITGDRNSVTLAPDEAPAGLLRFYYRTLKTECSRLPLGLVNEEFTKPGMETQVTLQNVYTDLDVVSPPQPEEKDEESKQRWFGFRLERGEGGERMPLLKAISQPEIPHLALIGLPGSGKTTFVNYLTALLAERGSEDLPSTLQGLLPVRLVLRNVAPCIAIEAESGTAAMLWDALEQEIARATGKAAAAIILPYLQRQLAQRGGLIMLDGLDEVPEAGKRRKCLLQAIASLQQDLPKCRFLLTARPYAYADPKWQLPKFAIISLADFNTRQIENFARRWYAAVRFTQGWDSDEAQKRAGELLQALDLQPYLGDLATRPLLLTLMATLHSHKSRLPEDRADLYEFSVGLLLSRWQAGRLTRDGEGNLLVEQGMEKVLGLGESRLRAALEELALETHQAQRKQSGGRDEAAQNLPADIPLGKILTTFSRLAPHDLNPLDVVRYLDERVGLLIGRGDDVYTFPHRSFQEYLTACRLVNMGGDVDKRLRDRVWEDLDWWREVFLLGVGKQRQGGLGNAVNLLNRLAPGLPQDGAETSDQQWLAASLAAEAALELRLPEHAASDRYYQDTLERLHTWLKTLVNGGHLSPRRRLQAGDLLGRLGDPRPGVALRLPARGEATGGEVPDLAWIKIPTGAFRMGSSEKDDLAYADEKPQHMLKLPDFWMARYPLTNAQFQPFLQQGGYEAQSYWTPEGWDWLHGARPDFSPIESFQDKDFIKNYQDWILGRENRSRPNWWEHRQWGALTRPVVGVSWYEAAAYCRWLDTALRRRDLAEIVLPQDALQAFKRGDLQIRLPGEAEWEKAARGSRQARWPWGDEWQEDHAEMYANTAETGLKETSPVGMFPAGENSYGLADMAGNAWEWTISKWGTDIMKPDYKYPYDAGDGRESAGGPDLRVVRGGSWNYDRRFARCAYRYWDLPSHFFTYLGFRVVLSLARPGF
jgi:formylglycine-generating enzyme required for sulfatase activity